MYVSKRKHAGKKYEYLAHILPVRIEVLFERNTSCSTGFSRGR
jgi:hypothetical protein